MSTTFELQIAERADRGKAATRRLRRQQNLVPAVIYGAGQEVSAIALMQKDLRKALEQEAFYSHLLTLKYADGREEKVILRDLQRHPARDQVLHADFLRVSDSTPISVGVPLHFINTENCIGVRQGGGNLARKASRVRIRCLPSKLPEYIEVDMTDIAVKQSVWLSDLKLPEGVEIPQLRKGRSYDLQVAAVNPPRGGGALSADEEADAGAEAPGAETEAEE